MSMGYMGYLKVFENRNGSGNGILLLVTGGGIQMTLEPMTSAALLGDGWLNATDTSHMADGPLRYEGNIDVDFQANPVFWNIIRKWAIYERAYARSIETSVDGNRIYRYKSSGNYDNTGAFNTQFNISASAGRLVTASLGVVALTREEVAGAGKAYIDQEYGVTTCDEYEATNPGNPDSRNTDPLPYWKTFARLLYDGNDVQPGLSVMDWSMDRGQNHTVVYTCSGSREATAVVMGRASVTGNVTLFHPLGVFDPIKGPDNTGTNEKPFLTPFKTSFEATIAGVDGGGNPKTYKIGMPRVMVTAEDFGFKDGNALVTRGFSITGMGGVCENGVRLPSQVMSEA